MLVNTDPVFDTEQPISIYLSLIIKTDLLLRPLFVDPEDGFISRTSL